LAVNSAYKITGMLDSYHARPFLIMLLFRRRSSANAGLIACLLNKQDEDPRCKTCGVNMSRHAQWLADSGDTHIFATTVT
jgi:hypothetical protein